MKQMLYNLLDWLRPRFVYAVVYTSYHPWTMDAAPVYFRTERAARRFMDKEEKTDPAIYNGAADHKLLKHPYHGKTTR